MRKGDQQLATPYVEYTDTKTNIEALTGISEGAVAYASDTNQFGTYNGTTWTWGQSNLEILTSDPASPVTGQAWVLKTDYPVGGQPIGLLLALTQATSYFRRQVSVRDNGTTYRTDIGDNEYQIKNDSYTLTVNDGTVEFTATATATLSTPYASKRWEINNSGTGTVTLNTIGGKTINGQASGTITLAQDESISVQYNGTNFRIL